MAFLELVPVLLEVHDTGVEVGLAWTVQNPTKVASVTLVDSVLHLPSLPFWLFRMPLLGSIIAYSGFAFRWVLRSCCFSFVTAEVAEDYEYLLGSSDGLRALLEALAVSNSSMDVCWKAMIAPQMGAMEPGIPRQRPGVVSWLASST